MSVLDRFDLASKTVLVTGGGRGLGAAAAHALSEAHARVVVVGRTQSALAATATNLGATGAYRVVDVADEREVVDLFSWLDDEYGGIDVLVNNAALADEGSAVDVTAAAWDRVFDVNARGPFFAAREMARRDAATERSIINISSLAATAGVKNQVAYSASKGAVESLTRALAIELAPRAIRVNAIAPGYFRTDMPAEVLANERALDALLRRIPQRRVPDPEEIGPTIVYLASAASAFLTGSIIHLDGGYTVP